MAFLNQSAAAACRAAPCRPVRALTRDYNWTRATTAATISSTTECLNERKSMCAIGIIQRSVNASIFFSVPLFVNHFHDFRPISLLSFPGPLLSKYSSIQCLFPFASLRIFCPRIGNGNSKGFSWKKCH